MAGDDEDSADKPFEATPRKLQEARRNGEVPLSQDLVTACVYLGFLVTAATAGLFSATEAGSALMAFLDHPDQLASIAFGGGSHFLAALIFSLAAPVGLWLTAPVMAALLGAIAQNALVFAPEKLTPKLSRISPISIAKQKFGWDGLFNFFKSFIKLLVYCIVLGLVGVIWAEDILSTPLLSFEASIDIAADVLFGFLSSALLVMFAIGAVDFLWQRAQHLKKHRMSLKELRDETKETEGDPYTKQARRQKGIDIATNRMLADVPSADVVIVNPTHYAVALSWRRAGSAAPVCVAKGTDEVAARIREKAQENGIPIHRDPPTARAIHATISLGSEIEPEHYRAVAAAIRFADAMRAKARSR